LPFEVTEEQAREFFKPAGEIAQIRWLEPGGVFKGCAFVQFADPASIDEAIKLNGGNLGGRNVRLDYAADKRKSGGGGGGGGGGGRDNQRPGDWDCPKCADFQFGRNVTRLLLFLFFNANFNVFLLTPTKIDRVSQMWLSTTVNRVVLSLADNQFCKNSLSPSNLFLQLHSTTTKKCNAQ
jgi:RNA recognition motif-containing protein